MFTTLGGLSAGAYVLSVFFPVKDESKNWKFLLTIGILLAIGLICLPFHLTRPQIAFIALMNPSSMMAQEAYWSAGFGIVLLIDFILTKFKNGSPRGLRIFGAVLATGLMIVMPTAYFAVFTLEAWHSVTTYLLFFLGDIAMGALFLALFQTELMKDAKYLKIALILAALGTISFAIEGIYLMTAGESIVPFIIATVLGAASIAAILAFKKEKLTQQNTIYAMFICMFIAVAIARYFFYVAGAI